MGNYWLMNIEDKISLENGNCCPPHRIPHTLPIIGEKVVDEPCHIHLSKLRMFHHRFYCSIIRCPYYNEMIEGYEGIMKGDL